ncbi:MAG: SufS family cysteine desulfurase [Patescibacteria group bacterium]|jgi:cysteine desulfurase/selenocysteine lyase
MIRRSDFPILSKKINGHNLIYFDNAATAQKPKAVILALDNYYRNYNSNVHRGINPLAEEATKKYEAARDVIADFVSAAREEIIVTRGATEGINLVARTWGEANLRAGDLVILSIAEHHANIVPWLQLKNKLGIKLAYIPVKPSGEFDFAAAKKILARPRVKLLALTQASNVLGIINPVKELISIARRHNVITLIDAAQSITHIRIDVRSLDCDFLVFSGHKIWGPTGVGVLYGRRELLEKMPPFLGGGDMIKSVYTDRFTTNELPYKFEAGTPPIAELIGLAAAISYVNKLGWKNIISQEKRLTAYFLKQIQPLKFIKVLGSVNSIKIKLPVFSLVVDSLHPHDAADLLGQEGIILRAGHHCAQPIHDFFGVSATLRASLSFYNTTKEIDIFIKKLKSLYQVWK